MKEEVSENPDGPEFEVWNHLWSGVDMAAQELRALDPKWRSTVEKIGKIIVSARTGLSQQAATVEADILSLEDDLLEDPWIRHAAEIEIAGDAIGKAEVALKRYFKIRPAITSRIDKPKIPSGSWLRSLPRFYAVGPERWGTAARLYTSLLLYWQLLATLMATTLLASIGNINGNLRR